MKKVVCLMMAALMVCMFAACGGSSSSTSGSASNALKIGGTGPLTGAAAIYGNAAKQGAEIAAEEINAQGGLQVELKYEDDVHDAEKAVNAYNALKDWGMVCSLGSVTSTPCVATSTSTFEDRIFAITPSASSPAVIEGKDNQFQVCFSDDNQGTASANYIASKGLAKKVAVIWKNDDVYSKGIYTTFMAGCQANGLEVVSDTTFTSDSQTDFSVQLTQAQSAGAELVFLPIYYDAASLIFAQANDMGYKPGWFGVDGMDGILDLENFDTSLAEGVMLLTPFSADAADERTQSFVKKYTEKYGSTPNQFAADAYDCVYALYQACKAAGIDGTWSAKDACDKLIEQFTTMSFDGLTGNGMTWDKTGAVAKDPKAVVIQNGAYVGLD